MGGDTDKVFTGSIPKLYDTYLVPLSALASRLHESVSIVATDLNQAMLDQASAVGTTRLVEWRQADALQLPFEDETFDAIVCQFGVMFFPEKAKAFSEVRRVLKPGGVFLFNVWDRITENEFADTPNEFTRVLSTQMCQRLDQ